MNEGAQRARDAVIRRYAEVAPVDVSRQLEGADLGEAQATLVALPAQLSAQLLSRLTEGSAAAILAGLTPEKAAPLLQVIDPGRGASLLARLDAGAREALLSGLPENTARELKQLSEYPEDTAGSAMDPRPFALHPDSTVEQALTRLRRRRRDSIHAVFVVDPGSKQLLGIVHLADLATADPSD
ncbi:MAG TPA: CBS domain-containing protein, partial [Candidatus Krumholzibacteria bacterium]